MKVNYPANCNNEANRIPFCIELAEKFKLFNNASLANNPLIIELKAEEAILVVDSPEWEVCIEKQRVITRAYRGDIFRAKREAISKAYRKEKAIAEAGAYWNPNASTHIANGAIVFPVGLNQGHHGSKIVFSLGLAVKVNESLNGEIDSPDALLVSNAVTTIPNEIIATGYWNPSLEVIY